MLIFVKNILLRPLRFINVPTLYGTQNKVQKVSHKFTRNVCVKRTKVALIAYKNGKAAPLQAWSDPEGSRKLMFPDFMTTTQDGGKVVNLTHWPPLLPGNTPGTVIYSFLGNSPASEF